MDSLFLAFAAVMALFVALAITVYLKGKARLVALAGFALWIAYAGALGYFGVIGNTMGTPPGPAFVLIPVALFAIFFLARGDTAAKIAVTIPLWLWLGAQFFRTGVELFLHYLAGVGLVPNTLTFEGANFDIVIGLSAPAVAWACANGCLSVKWTLIWNALGLAMLVNIAVRATMTMPGPMHLLTTDVPNLAFGMFPYTFIPALMAPLALTLHIMAIRALRRKTG